jgi:hypothetical protein
MSNIPTKEILIAFGAKEQPILLAGDQGGIYRAGCIVLKPTTNAVEAERIGDVLNSL